MTKDQDYGNLQKNPRDHRGKEVDLILDELWLKGTWHQMQTVKLFESNLWSLIGIGHPIVVYVIREVGYDGPGNVIGASGGPFTDWIALAGIPIWPSLVIVTCCHHHLALSASRVYKALVPRVP